MSEDEKVLVKRILDGDESAFLEIYGAYKHRLARTAAHFLGSLDSGVEDVVQETFAMALPKLKDFRFESSLYTWLNRFTVNFCFQTINKRKKTLASQTKDIEAFVVKATKPGAPKLYRGALYQDIEALSPQHEEVIRWKDIEGMSYLEIADRLKIAPGTVMSRLSRARKELKKRLKARKKIYEAFWKEG